MESKKKIQIKNLNLKTQIDELKYLAAYNIQHSPDEAFLRRWWTSKYNQSHKSDEFQRYTRAELLLEVFEDIYEKHPEKMKEFLEGVGDTTPISSGDELVDKWNEKLDKGETPDLTEGLPEHIRQRFAHVREEKNNPMNHNAQRLKKMVSRMDAVLGVPDADR